MRTLHLRLEMESIDKSLYIIQENFLNIFNEKYIKKEKPMILITHNDNDCLYFE